ncbi:MAG: 23S rRNA (adenine(2503)-C(2))-methyltransferase RlmN [Candidatus Omnitrophica bacterium]|nr:23S rRNA (adenine(2503)-C(2))-methyltransferase RlmN [Candidatus Omnitrophota bacterium]MDD5351706.1 23S rRNA (adenine(2503)-C(2))-methyltransferase RlmN [Candidatus Omnitrophota bacterium]MDD5550916.1 23S rRNA (adenine(2503)-C(2))-methyltransferase RlmN [Candidatus Omnitrophota bacterium]
MKKDIKTLTLKELAGHLEELKYPKYHAQQIFSWLYQKGAGDFSSMSDLSLKLRRDLEKVFYISNFILKEKLISRDGTIKYLFELEDKNIIESVLIPHTERNTVCLSTQVGCKFSCQFCASGALGFVRNLNQAEILNQILFIKSDTKEDITNIVFMGIGEPLDNYDTVLNSIRAINAKYGFNIGQRKITVSTAGVVEGIKKLSREGLQIELSVSLHGSTDGKRDKIMPINKKFPLKKLIPAIKEFAKLTKRKITFEYMLLGGFNTTIEDARQLISLTKGINCKVNLIPFNATGQGDFLSPAKLEMLFFRDHLLKNKTDVTIRQPRGQDIQAACGQLRLRRINQ